MNSSRHTVPHSISVHGNTKLSIAPHQAAQHNRPLLHVSEAALRSMTFPHATSGLATRRPEVKPFRPSGRGFYPAAALRVRGAGRSIVK
ncbi:MAG: hypothetical protein JRJ42_01170 [Deltaproteobacteria bacterium]|nr:hypothetical protein [Deltaproteobacteria bacterium]